jgi:hypothetical protein
MSPCLLFDEFGPDDSQLRSVRSHDRGSSSPPVARTRVRPSAVNATVWRIRAWPSRLASRFTTSRLRPGHPESHRRKRESASRPARSPPQAGRKDHCGETAASRATVSFHALAQLFKRALKSSGTTSYSLSRPAFGSPRNRWPRPARGKLVSPAILRADLDLFPRLDCVQLLRQALLSFHHRDLDHGFAPFFDDCDGVPARLIVVASDQAGGDVLLAKGLTKRTPSTTRPS